MRKIVSLMFVLLTLATMAFGNIGTAAAQDGTVENFTFTSDATWLTTPYFATVRGAVNVRAIPTQVGNVEFFTIPAGGSVQVAAGYDNNSWLLVRAWNNNGYMGAGWLNAHVANLTQVQTFDTPQAPSCPASDGLIQINVNIRFNAGWVNDSNANACNIIYEGRLEVIERHDYWIVRDSNDAANAQVTTTHYLHNGFMWLLEGTGWYGPATWSMGRGISNGNTAQTLRYPPMASYLAQDKQQVMRENGYQYPIRINALNGTSYDFAFGAFGASPNTVDRCDFTSPETMELTGIFNSANGSFVSTSVGAVACRTVILWKLPNNSYELLAFTGSRERLEYKRIYTAVLIPSAWDNQRLVDYITDTIIPDAHLPHNSTVSNNGVNGLPATITVR